jgi:hypothetical protein
MTGKVRKFGKKSNLWQCSSWLFGIKYPFLSFAPGNCELRFGDTVPAVFPYGSVPFLFIAFPGHKSL